MRLIRSLERLPGYDVHWPEDLQDLLPGLTAVLRIKNEAHNLTWVLPPLLDCVDHVVLVDNGSTDGSADVALDLAARLSAGDRLTAACYPFPVSRCGDEHLQTPPTSVHSLTHFYNWSFAHVRTRYSMKWDGDMVLTPEGVATVAGLAWQLGTPPVVVRLPHLPLYVESESVAYLDTGGLGVEPWIHPMSPEFTYVKGFDWELRSAPSDVSTLVLPEGLCFELKWLDRDEFGHWTDVRHAGSSVSKRKRREVKVFRELRQGRHQSLPRVLRVEAPAGQHIVDYVRRTWLPQAASLPRFEG